MMRLIVFLFVVLQAQVCSCSASTVTTEYSTRFVDKVDHVVSSYRLARDLVEERWSGSAFAFADLPCAEPSIAGFIPKSATGSQNPTLGMSIAEARQFNFAKLPIFSACQVRHHGS